jgi:hypothetical protein
VDNFERECINLISIHASKQKIRLLPALQKLIPGGMIGEPIGLVIPFVPLRHSSADTQCFIPTPVQSLSVSKERRSKLVR